MLGADWEVVGKVEPEGLFTRSVSVELPEQWELAMRVFVVWLCMILWKREGAGAGGGAAGGGG